MPRMSKRAGGRRANTQTVGDKRIQGYGRTQAEAKQALAGKLREIEQGTPVGWLHSASGVRHSATSEVNPAVR